MKTLTALVATAILIAFASPVSASDSTSQIIRQHAPAGISEVFYQCIDQADSDTVASAACLAAEQDRQDKRLNANYEKLLTKLGPEAKKKLLLAERAWLMFKETNGTFENAIYGGEIMANLELTQNEAFYICARADTLEKYLDIVGEQ
jgi:uncharacterized protein YecT (DUF1311 family)